MNTNFFITTIFIFTIFISCNQSNGKSEDTGATVQLSELKSYESPVTTETENQQIPVGKISSLLNDSNVVPSKTPVNTNADWDKKIIKTAVIKLEIKDFKKYSDYLYKAVKLNGAYVAAEEQSLSDEISETMITIKVPVAQFESMMNSLPGDDGRVLERKVNTDDVTGQVVDTKSRVEAKKQMRLKYMEFLKQSKNMEEVLQVQNEINNIQEQIESAASRIGFLSHQSAYSTINLSFYQPRAGYQSTGAAASFITRISTAFKNGTSWIADLLVGIISIWPLLLILLGFYMAWKIIRKPAVLAQKVNVDR